MQGKTSNLEVTKGMKGKKKHTKKENKKKKEE